ncbi:extracellular metalloproteinase 5 [Batrachochytrium salamandrivorans]|nr:extracellular metalloproteinase 5 [Batrachochytrium salamandrivorans]
MHVKTATDFISQKLNLARVISRCSTPQLILLVSPMCMVHIWPIVSVLPNTRHLPMLRVARLISFSSSFGTDQHLAKGDHAVSAPKASSRTLQRRLLLLPPNWVSPFTLNLNTLSSMSSSQMARSLYAYKLQLRNEPCDQVGRGSSPNGWTDGKATKGNNVITSTPSGKTTPSTSDGVFDTKFSSRGAPGTDANIAAAAVNLFYVSNMMHDISYQYGFTESAGNFQTNNFGKGGRGNDAITINVLNPSRVNNADFLTPLMDDQE